MEKIDARKHSPETQYEIRKQVIRLRKQGILNKVLAEGVGISEGRASKIWRSYIREGSKAISLGKRGRRTGEEVKNLIIDKTPDQLKFPFALWTRQAVKDLVRREYGIDMPIRTVGEYLSRWGFTPKKPVKKAREQRPEAVEMWLKNEYPPIARQAKKEKAEIFWGDETGIQNEANHVRGYALQGTKPVLRIPSKKERISMLSAVNNEGKVRFMIFKESMTSSRLIDFMRRLIKDAQRKVYLILDNLKAHHSKVVTRWLEKKKDHIRVVYLPPYCPELNPDEYLNNDLKQRVHSGTQSITAKELKHKTESFMRQLLRRPHRVKKYFEHPAVRYAA